MKYEKLLEITESMKLDSNNLLTLLGYGNSWVAYRGSMKKTDSVVGRVGSTPEEAVKNLLFALEVQ